MMDLSDSERISMIRSAVLIQYTRVTDGRTDGLAWHIRAVLSRVKIMTTFFTRYVKTHAYEVDLTLSSRRLGILRIRE